MKRNKNEKLAMTKSQKLGIFVTSFFILIPLFALAEVVTNTNTSNSNANVDTNINSNSNINVDPNLNQINQEIDTKRAKVEELRKKTEVYQQNIKIKQQEALTLQNQMAVMDLQIQQNENDIETIKQEMDTINLELTKLDTNIADKTKELDYNKEILSEYLRMIYLYDQKSYLEIIMTKGSFSEFFDHLKYTQDLESKVGETVAAVKADKDALDQQKVDKEQKKTDLTSLMDKLSTSIATLDNQKQYKTALLDETQNSQAKFEDMLVAAQKEQQAAESDIGSLESKARQQLQQQGIDLNISSTLMWPVAPTRGISAYFHDTGYIFRRYFEHPAIDIPAPQGTAVRAADNGYVVRAKNAGMGYSYIMIVHNDTLSTVYGHISRIDVDEDSYVVRGQQIGLSGGIPGTPGAGNMTTGAHLHFEVRSGGIPVDPLDYLPSY